MTKTSHTPGPWRITRDQTPGQFVTIDKVRDAHNSVICTLHVNAEANARLIAAAPDLLEALHDLTIWAGHRPDGRGSWAYVNACVTLCRATGQEYQDTHYPPIAKATGEERNSSL